MDSSQRFVYQEGKPKVHKDEHGDVVEMHYDFYPPNLSRLACTEAQNPPRHPLSQRFHDLLKDIGYLHDKKQKDYGTTEDPFANLRGATEFGLPSYMAAFLEMKSCMQKIISLVNNNKLENDLVENVLKDMAVFSLIALVLYEEEQILKDIEEYGD